jgi:alkaline phosphatase
LIQAKARAMKPAAAHPLQASWGFDVQRFILVFLCAAAALTATGAASSRRVHLAQTDDPYFAAGAADAARVRPANTRRARNVILFVGDGMGVSTVTAARIFAGQSRSADGESFDLTMDTAPHSAFSRTYSHDYQIADSAATATALVAGVKTRSGVLSVSSAVPLGDCAAQQGRGVTTLFEAAEAAGLSTGIVSTARITHATPAAAYAHSAHRNWENDAVAARSGGANCPDIARQLVEWPAGDGFEIALGGGRANFLPNSVQDPGSANVRGQRADGRNLTAEWAAKPGHVYVSNREQLTGAAIAQGARVLGLFAPSHMAYEVDRDKAAEPSLAEMTAAAITRLSQDRDGYVLMVEGGRIDHAHHDGRAHRALADTVALDEAVRTALDMTRRQDALILVTADHSHTLTIAGYARRGTPILGLSVGDEDGGAGGGADGLPYTTLGYINGPGASRAQRSDLTNVDTTHPDFRQQALVPLESETHGGEDVPVFAWGPGSESVSGTIEQHAIFHILFRALGFQAVRESD